MQAYLCMRDFQKRKNKQGVEYGWDVAIYARPEEIFGYKNISKAYKETPEESYQRIMKQLKKHLSFEDEKTLGKMIMPRH